MTLYKTVGNERVEMTPAEEAQVRAEWAANEAAEEAKKNLASAAAADRAVKLEDVPASVNSLPALRMEVNKIKEVLRDFFGEGEG